MIELSEGMALPTQVLQFSLDTLANYAMASGDHNPIHLSQDAAQALGLPGIIAHGMLTMGAALRVVTAQFEPQQIHSYAVRFAKPVVVDAEIGAQIQVAASVTKIIDGIATISIEAKCDGQKVLGAANVEVAISE